jgi:hypothetical protein
VRESDVYELDGNRLLVKHKHKENNIKTDNVEMEYTFGNHL